MVQRALKFLGVLLLLAPILALSALILIILLGIFVVWLAIVGAMATGLVISDLVGAFRQAPHTLNPRPVPAGQ